MLLLAAGCAPQAQPPVANPIAEALVSQAQVFNGLARACRDDAAAYREHPQAGTAQACCGEGILQVSRAYPGRQSLRRRHDRADAFVPALG